MIFRNGHAKRLRFMSNVINLHEWFAYNTARGPKSFPGRKPARICLNCGLADRPDVNPICLHPALVVVQSGLPKELR